MDIIQHKLDVKLALHKYGNFTDSSDDEASVVATWFQYDANGDIMCNDDGTIKGDATQSDEEDDLSNGSMSTSAIKAEHAANKQMIRALQDRNDALKAENNRRKASPRS